MIEPSPLCCPATLGGGKEAISPKCKEELRSNEESPVSFPHSGLFQYLSCYGCPCLSKEYQVLSWPMGEQQQGRRLLHCLCLAEEFAKSFGDIHLRTAARHLSTLPGLSCCCPPLSSFQWFGHKGERVATSPSPNAKSSADSQAPSSHQLRLHKGSSPPKKIHS